jgi:hypothetical protein
LKRIYYVKLKRFFAHVREDVTSWRMGLVQILVLWVGIVWVNIFVIDFCEYRMPYNDEYTEVNVRKCPVIFLVLF